MLMNNILVSALSPSSYWKYGREEKERENLHIHNVWPLNTPKKALLLAPEYKIEWHIKIILSPHISSTSSPFSHIDFSTSPHAAHFFMAQTYLCELPIDKVSSSFWRPKKLWERFLFKISSECHARGIRKINRWWKFSIRPKLDFFCVSLSNDFYWETGRNLPMQSWHWIIK